MSCSAWNCSAMSANGLTNAKHPIFTYASLLLHKCFQLRRIAAHLKLGRGLLMLGRYETTHLLKLFPSLLRLSGLAKSLRQVVVSFGPVRSPVRRVA